MCQTCNKAIKSRRPPGIQKEMSNLRSENILSHPVNNRHLHAHSYHYGEVLHEVIST